MSEREKRTSRGKKYKSEFERNKDNSYYMAYYGREGSEDDGDFEADSIDLDTPDEFDSDFSKDEESPVKKRKAGKLKGKKKHSKKRNGPKKNKYRDSDSESEFQSENSDFSLPKKTKKISKKPKRILKKISNLVIDSSPCSSNNQSDNMACQETTSTNERMNRTSARLRTKKKVVYCDYEEKSDGNQAIDRDQMQNNDSNGDEFKNPKDSLEIQGKNNQYTNNESSNIDLCPTQIFQQTILNNKSTEIDS